MYEKIDDMSGVCYCGWDGIDHDGCTCLTGVIDDE